MCRRFKSASGHHITQPFLSFPVRTFHVNGTKVPVLVSTSKRSYGAKIAYDPTQGIIRITAPSRFSSSMCERILDDRKIWLCEQIEYETRVIQEFDARRMLHLLGHAYNFDLQVSRLQSFWVTQERATLQAPSQKMSSFFKKVTHELLKKYCDEKARIYADQINRAFSMLTTKALRSRWGSCRQDGHVTFSWYLLFAPQEVLDYVIAHEVAHLAEMNHSAHFWKTVEQLLPDYASQRRWLRVHGRIPWILGRHYLKRIELESVT